VRRRAFLLATAAAAAARPARGQASPVGVGLERVAADAGRPLAGRRVGLLAHAASVTADGRHAIEVLRESGVEVVRLFAPEHGLRGDAPAGGKVEGGQDPASGLPVVSLYGDRLSPSAEDLRGLEALVVDLQDAGVRFYTYASTMLLCLASAADAGLEAFVLDRPNPLGGVRLDGPVRDPALPVSVLSMAPGPLVHGLTLGEMARFVVARRPRPARLTVVAMQGWKRSMTWADTGRPWTNPSPNLRSPDAALAYPGTCLLEATNVSEGRGTDSPFLLFGAPWLRPEALVREVAAAGFSLEPQAFVPFSSAAAPAPKYLGKACSGLRVKITGRARCRPWELGLRLLAALLKLQPQFMLRRDGRELDALLGTRAVRTALEQHRSVEAILEAEAPELERFAAERQAALLY
jgi:uncharacterized protein YbbC (DUF1343 family)